MPASQPDDPWTNQPDVGPYPTEDEGIRFPSFKALLAEAERRGAERGWDEGEAHMAQVADWWVGPDAPSANPYRRPAVAPSEPSQPSGDQPDTPDAHKTGEAP